MPRCGVEGFVSNPGNTTTPNVVVLETPDGDIRVQGARVLSITRGEWHPIQQQGSDIGMEVNTLLFYPAMDVVICWEPGGQVSWASPSTSGPPPTQRVFLPSGATLDTAALNGLGLQFGFSTSEMGVYTAVRNGVTVTGNTPYWVAYSCFIGDKKITNGPDNGDPMTEYVMKKPDNSIIKGGWVFATPDTSSSSSSTTGPTSQWLSLSATRFAIIGAPYGALFGSGRELYYECGLEEDATQLAAIKAEFGFASTEGTCAYIKVYDDINDFLINVEPE